MWQRGRGCREVKYGARKDSTSSSIYPPASSYLTRLSTGGAQEEHLPTSEMVVDGRFDIIIRSGGCVEGEAKESLIWASF